jgi:phosphoglycerate dehydrogenase-like enzyme
MAGLESQMFPELAASPIPLTNAAGVFANSLAEFALSAILYFAKDIPRMERQRRERRWEQFDIVELRNAKLGIFGYGGIGRATARLAKSFGMKVFIVRRKSAARDEYTDVVVHPDALDDLLPELDYILISAPLTQETHARFGDAQFRRLKPSAVLINLGRGPIVVEEALLDALRQNRIKGAALDVFDTEPLPSEHPLYSLDNVLLSPHTADHTATWLDEATGLFLDNYRRFQNGEPLLNVADKSAGY